MRNGPPPLWRQTEEVGSVHPGEEKAVWRPHSNLQVSEGSYKDVREEHFVRNCSGRTRSNGYKLKEGKFRLDVRKKIFTLRVVRHWTKCPGRLWMPCPPKPPAVFKASGQSVEQSSIIKAVPVHSRGVGSRWYFRSIPIQAMITKKTTNMRHVDKPLGNVRLLSTNISLLVLSSISSWCDIGSLSDCKATMVSLFQLWKKIATSNISYSLQTLWRHKQPLWATHSITHDWRER